MHRRADHAIDQARRRTLKQLTLSLLAVSSPSQAFSLRNECLDPKTTPSLLLEQNAWQGLNPQDLWDCHTHIVGSGNTDSGIEVSEQMRSPLRHPFQFVQYWAYANAACVGEGREDQAFVERLDALLNSMPFGVKAMLYAFDRTHGANGEADHINTSFFVPNAYAQRLAQAHPDRFEWVASIHPYRPDCVEALQRAAEGGACAIKWLPPVMGIDPSSSLCDRFYRAAAALDIPIISHGGEEKAVHGANQQAFGNPLRLRRAMDFGVRVVIAHCASLGEDQDDQGRWQPSFDLFAQMMSETQWQQHLFGDISAIVLRNRKAEVIKTLLTEQSWHKRLLYGSDYPLTGIPLLISPQKWADEGLLDEDAVAPLETLQRYHAFRFDLTLKRNLVWNKNRFAAEIFATRRFFQRKTQTG